MLDIFRKRNRVESTPFSDFIRNAKPAEKKQVYTVVLEKATERQKAVVLKVQASR